MFSQCQSFSRGSLPDQPGSDKGRQGLFKGSREGSKGGQNSTPTVPSDALCPVTAVWPCCPCLLQTLLNTFNTLCIMGLEFWCRLNFLSFFF